MARPDKAQIAYTVGEGDSAAQSVLRFHSVIAEEHEISSEITKYPVQTGFQISNHAIKKNRKVSIRGIITNHLIVGAEEFHEYGGSNTKIMFSTLEELVKQATPCDVTTNLGLYSPVIFTKFKTKTQAGMTDAMEFTISGEEAQVGGAVNKTTPTLLVFTPLTAEERAARVEELLQVGIEASDEAIITETQVDFNESFQVETTGTNGKTSITTYERVGYDPTNKVYNHEVHTSDTATANTSAATTSVFNWNAFMLLDEDVADVAAVEEPKAGGNTSALPDVDLTAGAKTTAACLGTEAIALGRGLVKEAIKTGLGDLKKTIYGASYGMFGVNGDTSTGQMLLGIGTDCLVAGAIGSVDPKKSNPDQYVAGVPSGDDALKGAADIGDTVTTDTLGVAAPTTLTKVSDPSGNTSFFGDLL